MFPVNGQRHNGFFSPSQPQGGLVYPDGTPVRYSEMSDGFAIPHVLTFNSFLGLAWRKYFHGRFDEAMRHSREDALAMRVDVNLMGKLQERYLGTVSLKWHLDTDDDRDEEHTFVKKHLTSVIRRTPYLFHLIRNLLDAVWYGRYGVQLDWQFRAIGGIRSLVAERHLPVNGDKIGHTYDHIPWIHVYAASGEDDIPNASIEYTSSTMGGRAVVLRRQDWRERFIIHRHIVSDEDFLNAEMAEAIHGIGLRHVLYWWNWLKMEWISNISDWAERAGLGVRLWYYESGNDRSRREVQEAAEDNARRVNILVPRNPDSQQKAPVEYVDVATAGPELLFKLITYIDEFQERFIIGQTLSSDTEGSGLGGTGVAAMHAATKSKIIAFDANNLAETLTWDFVRVIQRWTLPDTYDRIYPRWVFDIDEPDPQKRLQAIQTAASLGVTFIMDEVRALTGASAPQEGDEVIGGQQQQPGGMPGQPGMDQQQPPDADQQQEDDSLLGQTPVPEREGDEWLDGGADQEPAAQMQRVGKSRQSSFAQSAHYAQVHAPRGGVTVNGTFYPGGRFIPDTALQAAEKSEPRKVAALKAQANSPGWLGKLLGKKAVDEHHPDIKPQTKEQVHAHVQAMLSADELSPGDVEHLADLVNALPFGYQQEVAREAGIRHHVVGDVGKVVAEHVGQLVQGKAARTQRVLKRLMFQEGTADLAKDADWDRLLKLAKLYEPTVTKEYLQTALKSMPQQLDFDQDFLPHAGNRPNRLLPDATRPSLTNAEKNSIGAYAGSGYHEQLNVVLRQQGKATKTDIQLLQHLETAFAKAQPFAQPVTVYRGVSGHAGNDFVKKLVADAQESLQAKKGKLLQFAGIVSTSTSDQHQFVKEGDVVLVIRARLGLDGMPYSMVPKEDEMMLPHNSRFACTRMEQKKVGQKTVHVLYLDQVV